MPTYEYECEACGNKFEEFQSITAKPIKKCPKCGKNKVNRLLGTGAGMIFKGSGFYITDYRSEGYKNAAKSRHRFGCSSSDSKPSESKPAAKADTPASPPPPPPPPPAAPAKKKK